MAAEAVHLRASLANHSGSIVHAMGEVRLTNRLRGTFGTVVYPQVNATEHVLWRAAEITGVIDASTDGVRVRLSNGVAQFFIDDADMVLKLVTDTTQWDTEFSKPHLLASLDLWTERDLEIIVRLVSTVDFPDPRVKGINVLMDFPAWEGAVAQAVRDVVEKVSTIFPIMVERFPFDSGTLTAATQSFNIGDPHSEHGYDLQEVVQVLVDGTHKSATLSNGVVTLLGPPAPIGSVVRIAVSYKPNTAVRRVGEVRFIDRTPAWHVSGLVVEDGLDGIVAPLAVAGYEAFRRKVELRITVNGVSHRQADALAMRLALQREFAEGLQIAMPSGRCLSANVRDGVVEVVPEAGTNLPMASTILALALDEYVHARIVRNSRDQNAVPPGSQPLFTELSITLPDGVTVSATSDDFTDC